MDGFENKLKKLYVNFLKNVNKKLFTHAVINT